VSQWVCNGQLPSFTVRVGADVGAGSSSAGNLHVPIRYRPCGGWECAVAAVEAGNPVLARGKDQIYSRLAGAGSCPPLVTLPGNEGSRTATAAEAHREVWDTCSMNALLPQVWCVGTCTGLCRRRARVWGVWRCLERQRDALAPHVSPSIGDSNIACMLHDL